MDRARRLHDLRQPLSAIMAAASALRLDPDVDPATRDRLLRIVVENAERLSEMLEDPQATD
jgi:K+-sensing histidine kinase KdpD